MSTEATEPEKPEPMGLLEMPNVVLRQIFSYLSYDKIAQLRPVCKTFNEMCGAILNKGYHKMEKYHGESLKKVKAQLPRRESERKHHRLARHGDILMAIETRLSLLSMTYGKFIDQNLCCFIPGKVIDEVFRIISMVVRTDKEPPRPHEVLQELRDISSMAMEHFDECVQPRLRAKMSVGLSDPLIAAANLAIVEANDTVLGFRPAFRTNITGAHSHYGGSICQSIANNNNNRRASRVESKLKELEKKCKDKDKKLAELSSRVEDLEKHASRTVELEKQLLEIRTMMRRDPETASSQKKFASEKDDLDFTASRAKRSRLDTGDNDEER